MADVLDSNGLTLETYSEMLAYVQGALNEIYATDGDTINFGSETPDGQFTNILAQIGADARQLIAEVYNSFNPDNCQGVLQDQRYALNYMTRKGGTYTIQNIDITVDKTITLEGLDENYYSPTASSYTLSDDSGNQWYLITTTQLTQGTTTSLPFRSQNIGLVQPAIGTIVNQVTKVLGVTNVINSIAPTSLGEDEESDVEFRIRRNRSTAIRGRNNYDAMVGQILQIPDVKDAKIFVNNTGSDSSGITGDPLNEVPPFNIWVIVDGGAPNSIADVIYQNSSGLATFGYSNSSGINYNEVNIQTVSGQLYNVKFNTPNPVRLYIRFKVKILENNFNLNTDNIAKYVANNLAFSLNQPAETSYVTDIAAQSLLQYNANIYALDVQLSLGATETTTKSSSTITAVTTDVAEFQEKMGGAAIDDGNYVFSYSSGSWHYDGNVVSLADYGIEITGSASNGDSITVDYNGNWTDFIPSTSWMDKFVVSSSDVTVTPQV